MLVGLAVTRAATSAGVGTTSVRVALAGSGVAAGSAIGPLSSAGAGAALTAGTAGGVGAGIRTGSGTAGTDTGTDLGAVCWCWTVARIAPVAITISPSTASGPSTQTMGSSP